MYGIVIIVLASTIIEARNVRITNGVIFKPLKKVTTYKYSIPIIYKEDINITALEIERLTEAAFRTKSASECELEKVKNGNCSERHMNECKSDRECVKIMSKITKCGSECVLEDQFLEFE